MKNIRGALFVLSLSIVLLFNSITIAQAKAPTIWVCSPTSSSYTLIKFQSLNSLRANRTKTSTGFYRQKYWSNEEDYKKFVTQILNEKNCKDKIEKQSYTRLYKKIRNDFKTKAKKALSGARASLPWKEKKILKSELDKLSKKYNEYPLKNLASTTQTQQVAKKKGCIKGNCYNGYGTYIWPMTYDGKDLEEKYVGEWKNGTMHGQGTHTSFDGKTVSGIWKNHKLVKEEPSQTQQVAKKEKKVAKKKKPSKKIKDVHDKNLIAPDTWMYFVDVTTDSSSAGQVTKFDPSHFLSNDIYLERYIFDEKEKQFIYRRQIRANVEKKYLRISKKLSQKLPKVKKIDGYIANAPQDKKYWKKFHAVLDKNKHSNLEELIEEYVEETKNYNLKKDLIAFFNIPIDSKLAKKEPSQTQQVAKKIAVKNILNYNCKYKSIDKKFPIRLKLKNKNKVYFEDKQYILFGSETDLHEFYYFNYQTFEIGQVRHYKFTSVAKNKKSITNSLITKYSFPPVAQCYRGELEIAKKEPKKEEKKVAKKKKQDWKCRIFGLCQPEEKTQQVAKKIINIYCVKNNYSAIRMEKGEKPNCKNGEFKVVKNEYLLLETVYDNLASYFDLNDPNEVVLFDRRVRDIFKITHQDFNKLTDTQQVAKIESTKKSFNIFKKEEKKITTKEVLALGKYAEFNSYPEGMLKEFKNCKKQFCRGKVAGKKVYEIFARRGELWHQRHPGDIIHGMAWFEIFYLEKLRKNEKQIARYIKNGPEGYSSKMKMNKDVSSLHGLIKTNKGRIKMREALGLSLNDDLETVLRRHWLLGDFLNKDKLKVKRVAIGSDIKKRKKLLAEYKSALTKYKNKLEEERRATN